jgi:hypothetical protein
LAVRCAGPKRRPAGIPKGTASTIGECLIAGLVAVLR